MRLQRLRSNGPQYVDEWRSKNEEIWPEKGEINVVNLTKHNTEVIHSVFYLCFAIIDIMF